MKFQKFLSDYTKLFAYTVLLFILIRTGEYAYAILIDKESLSFHLFITKSVKYDTLFVLMTGALMLLPAFLISIISFLTYKIIIRFVLFCIILFQLVFTQYFLTNSTVLTAILLEFTPSEMYQIARNEISVNRLYFWLMNLIVIALTIWLFIKRGKNVEHAKKGQKIFQYLFSCFFIVALLSHQNLFKQFQAFDSEYEFLIGNSKPIFFLKSYSRINEKKTDSELNKKLETIHYQNRFPNRSFISRAFPLIYNSDDQNVLGSFFVDSNMRPNIILIISESLSGTFSGKSNVIGGSITPFTDSLADQGLLWTHFLSNTDRSFGVLPNILGSLPFGTNERGFMGSQYQYEFGKRYPNHTGLIQYFKEAGYRTKYYFGGWRLFDKIEYFIKYNGIDEFTADHNFDTTKYKMKEKHKGQSIWGYNDHDLFAQSIDDLEKDTSGYPFFSIYQTLTNHSPYNIAPERYYDQEYLEKRLLKLGHKLNDLNIRPNILSSIISADDDLKYFFDHFKTDPRFDNTIFIIVGDHGVNLNLSKHSLERYHVPLIIYSPLIKQPAFFKGMCSHIDIAPSVLSLLKNNFDLHFSDEKHFIGEGLDTSKHFKSNRFIPLSINRLEIPCFIVNNQMKFGKQYLEFDENWETTLIGEEKSINTANWIQTYSVINRMVCNENRIWKPALSIHHNDYYIESK